MKHHGRYELPSAEELLLDCGVDGCTQEYFLCAAQPAQAKASQRQTAQRETEVVLRKTKEQAMTNKETYNYNESPFPKESICT